MKSIAIIGGRVIDPLNHVDAVTNVYIEKGKIKAISPQPPNGFQVESTIDAFGCLICPGLVDLHATFFSNQPCANLSSALERAVCAGIIHLASAAFTSSRNFEPAEIQQIYGVAQKIRKAKIYLIGALTQQLEGKRLNELMLLKEAGCIGFSNGNFPIINTLVKRRCYDYASMLNLKIFTSLQNPYLNQIGCMHEGDISIRLGLSGIPVLSEVLALAEEILLIEETGIQAHLYRISAAKSTELLQSAIEKKLPITSDVAIHQLFLTDDDVRLEDGLCHVLPPFRTKKDKGALRRAITKGYINAISSDHVTLPRELKALPFPDSAPGVASWPLLLPLTLQIAREENLSLSDALSYITVVPAKILGIDAGHINIDSLANLVIVDPERVWTLSEKDLLQFGQNNPFFRSQLRGKLKYTLIDGEVVYADS